MKKSTSIIAIICSILLIIGFLIMFEIIEFPALGGYDQRYTNGIIGAICFILSITIFVSVYSIEVTLGRTESKTQWIAVINQKKISWLIGLLILIVIIGVIAYFLKYIIIGIIIIIILVILGGIFGFRDSK